ncbi:YhcH/YjgK/YiaL family protein [Sunxiuqinia sp. A32]|uniref:YhcH/YjgK/YiaL family protein n=1 Tax=Sunxiuqinia sp. A32 TaxID=3461496 RepID=UPI0040458114
MNEINNWIENGSWKDGISTSLHLSTNKIEFFRQYHSNPDLWEKVFQFFKETDFDKLEPGKYTIDGEIAFAMVSEYETKEFKDAKWESHRKYIDLQYVIDGDERMGVMNLKKTQGATEYNSEKDLLFYGDGEGDYYEANSEVFFLFFPTDVHRPGIQIDGAVKVKKMVVKILAAE